MEILNALFKLAVESGASDVIVKSDKPGYLRIDGGLISVDMEPIDFEVVRMFIEVNMPKVFRKRWKEEGQVDFSYTDKEGSRFRVNGFHQRGLVSLVMRHIKTLVPTFTQLNLQSDPLIRFAKSKDGIVFICGATGSGKSTTMAAMIDWINQNLDKHIVTIEDPIEYLFSDQKSLIEQREIGLDVPNFDLALKSVLRQDPDIILLGEMRDRESFETAISAAETGHLVISTMHASSVGQALTRLFEFFPSDQQQQARRQIAGSLRGCICQKLLPSIDGLGRVPINEILNADVVVKNLILLGQFENLNNLLEDGSDSLSFSFNKDIYRLIKAGKISKADGLHYSPNPQALDMNLKGIFFKN
jgi:twitching motility protein PilT